MTNGKTKIIYWLVAFIQTCGICIISYWVGRVEKVEAKLEHHEEAMVEKRVEIESRLSRTESNYVEIIRRLDRIDHTLDTWK